MTSLFKLLEEYNLLKSKKRLEVLLNMRPHDYTEFMDKAEKILLKWKSVNASSLNNPFNLWLPYPNEIALEQLPNYSFLFEKIYLVDPMSDLCSLLEMDDNQKSNYWHSIIKELGLSQNQTAQGIQKWFDGKDYKVTHFARVISASRLNKVIETYINNRELIEEGVVIPFIEPPLNYEPDLAMSFGVNLVTDLFEKTPNFANFVKTKIKHYTKDQSIDMVLDNNEFALFAHETLEVWRFLLTTSAFKTAFPSEKSSSIELGDINNQIYINKIIELGVPLIGDNAHLLKNIGWPTPEDELTITAIKGIPSGKILEIRDKEQPAIEKFRYNTRTKLEAMRMAVKGDDYSQLVKKFQSEQKEQVAEIKLLVEHIKKDHLRKMAHQISLMAFSAGGAVLSASVASQNPASLIGVGVAGAGLSKGISSLIETWISYQEKMDELKHKDNYILWRIQQVIR